MDGRPAKRLYVSQTLMYDNYQTLYDDSAHWALPIYTIFNDPDCNSRPLQCQTVLTENCIFLSD